MNPGVPVFAVLTGHVQTPDVLNNTISAGRYAGSNEQPMKPLSSSDSRKYATRMLHWVRTGETHLPGSVRQPDRRIAGWIDKECGGWPHHLRNAMASIAEEHLRSDSVELANLDGKRVEENLTRRRLIYYQGRLQSPAFDEMEDVIGNVLSDLHAAPLNRSGLLACARKHIREAGEGLWWRHGRPEAAAREFVLGDGGLIEKGLVGRTMSGNDVRFVCPIASMRRYVQTGEHEVGSRFPDIRGDHFR